MTIVNFKSPTPSWRLSAFARRFFVVGCLTAFALCAPPASAAIPPLLPGTVEREAVRYRVALHDALRQLPDEHRRRLEAWRELRRRWSEHGADPAHTEAVLAWLREATRRSRPGQIEPLPELPQLEKSEPEPSITPIAPPPTAPPRAADSPPPQAWPSAPSPPRRTQPAPAIDRTAPPPLAVVHKTPHIPAPAAPREETLEARRIAGLPTPAPAEKIESLEPPRAATARPAAQLQPGGAMPKTPTGARPEPPAAPASKIAAPASKIAPPASKIAAPRLDPLPPSARPSQREPKPAAPPAAPAKTFPPPPAPLRADVPELLPPVEAAPAARRVVARKPVAPAKELADLLFGDPPPSAPPPRAAGEAAKINEVELMARIRGYNHDLRRLEFKLAEPDRAWTARELAEALGEIQRLEEARGIVDLYLPLVEKARRPHMGRPHPLENVKRLLRARVERERAELTGVAAATNRRWRIDVLDALLRQLANDGMTE